MATTVCLTRTRGSVAVVPLGAFGRRVAALFGDVTDDDCCITSEGAVRAAFMAPADIVVAALWRPSPGLCEEADGLSFALGRPWLPVTMDYPVIHVGPLVLPPVGPCYRCYLRRRAQHDRQHAITRALYAAYDQDADLGPTGFLPHQARLAASAAAMLIKHSGPTGTTHPGSVITISLSDHHLNIAPVMPCHDCERCAADHAPVRGQAIMRLVAELRPRGR